MKTALFVCFFLWASTLAPADDALPGPWKHQDINPATVPGTAGQDGGVFTLAGTMDIWGVADGSHFMWQPRHGDVEIVARVTAIDNPGGVGHAKASLCIRESLKPGSRQVTLCVTPVDGTQFIYRDTADAKAVRVFQDAESLKASVPKGQFPCWLKLIRHGDDVTGYESPDGQQWHLSGSVKLALVEDTLAGLAASSHKPDVLTKATFDHLEISGPAAMPTTAPR